MLDDDDESGAKLVEYTRQFYCLQVNFKKNRKCRAKSGYGSKDK